MNRPQFVYPFPCWWTGECLQFLPVMNKAAKNICVQVLTCRYIFISLTKDPGVVFTYHMPGHVIKYVFNFRRTCQNTFQRDRTILTSRQPGQRAPAAQPFRQRPWRCPGLSPSAGRVDAQPCSAVIWPSVSLTTEGVWIQVLGVSANILPRF